MVGILAAIARHLFHALMSAAGGRGSDTLDLTHAGHEDLLDPAFVALLAQARNSFRVS
jgi:hypothetical protein